MNILVAASEMSPFYKLGERADVIGTLAQEIAKLGHDVSVMLPGFSTIDRYRFGFKSLDLEIPIPIGRELWSIEVYSSEWNGLTIYLLENDMFKQGSRYSDINSKENINGLRFIFYARAIIEVTEALHINPDVIHAHEWQTGMTFAYLSTLFKNSQLNKKAAKFFTIHNLGFQGIFSESVFTMSQLPREVYECQLRYHGNVSFIRGGICFADAITTVSETYAKEITETELGMEFQKNLQDRKEDIYGILNGIEYKEWNPETDRYIKQNYSIDNLEGKYECRKSLLNQCGFEAEDNVSLVGMVTKLNDQKGFDIIEKATRDLHKLDIRVVILGIGTFEWHSALLKYQELYPERLKVFLRYDKRMEHQIYAGADMLLMPSKYEPCGLGQLIAMRYGTVPVVHATGGLTDTVIDFYDNPENGTGISFKDYSPDALLDAVTRAVNAFSLSDRMQWNNVVKNCMSQDFSWKKSASKYVELYNLISKKIL
ncbi:MAG: glycogen synthase [Candidatus Latescibacteria bacterium]|jgi:starch synthase|nr:glycogen synthase [Candidatus Latescibacterota bacterium]